MNTRNTMTRCPYCGVDLTLGGAVGGSRVTTTPLSGVPGLPVILLFCTGCQRALGTINDPGHDPGHA